MTFLCLHCYAEITPARMDAHLSVCDCLDCRKPSEELDFLIHDMVFCPN